MSDDGPGPGAPAEPLEVLLRVQDLDITLAQLDRRRHDLPERAQLAELDRLLRQRADRAAALEAERTVLADRQAELEEQEAALGARRVSLERRMYDARGPARDLQAMDDEVHHLEARRSALEDVELEVMEAMEPLDTELAAISAEREQLGARAASLRQELAAAEAVVDAEAAAVASARGSEADRLPGPLRQRYEALRARMGGVGAARLVGNRCSGCHLELPAMEVDRIRHLPPGTVVTCDQCGRILVPAGPGDAGPRPAR